MKYAVLVAGGTGGHINAALALGEELSSENWEIHYLTGKRPLDFKLFNHQKVTHLQSKPLRTKNPLRFIQNLILNLWSFFVIIIFYLKKRPSAVIGAGGYVCGPTLLAGYLLRIPVFIIEQNAIMGLTNRILGWISRRIFVHFSKTRGLSPFLSKKVLVVGNPTRKSIRPTFHKIFDGQLRVLVFGGSLGASQINNVIWDILKLAPQGNITIHHQLGSNVVPPSIVSSISYHPKDYIDDIQKEYEWCDVIISRAGASTISELAIIKKPVLIFPFPGATDNHQFYNAKIFKEESDFTVEILDPALSHNECVQRTSQFLDRALNQELIYTKTPSAGNKTCEKIIKEIKKHAGVD